MEKFLKLLAFLFAVAAVLNSCSDDDDNELTPGELAKGAYILNYGGYSQNTSSITKYDYENDDLTAFYYQQQNGGSKIGSAPQWIYEYDDLLYLMNNNPDRVIVTDLLFVAQDTITTDVAKPRNCVGYGDYLYISCLGADPDWGEMADTYILKYNVVTKSVEKKIVVAGGPEGLAIANGKLYAALNYKKAVAVMDLSTEAFTYIDTETVSSYFLKDKNGNLYVTQVATWSDPSPVSGLGYIDTQTDEMTFYPLADVSTSYASIFAFSKDFSKIYLVAGANNDNWELVGGVRVFDVSSRTFEAEALVSNITGINGVSVNPIDGKIYVFVSNGVSTNGDMLIFSSDETEEATKKVGASPAMALFLD
jgi:hypothetical protein